MQDLVELLFIADVAILMTLVMGAVWSVAFPARRIWPSPGKGSWQNRLTWTCFYLVFALNAALLIIDWNSWVFDSYHRFIIGVPLAVIGALLVSWGVATLGVRNSSGLKDGFVSSGPYGFTRNPQYLGDMMLFVGLIARDRRQRIRSADRGRVGSQANPPRTALAASADGDGLLEVF